MMTLPDFMSADEAFDAKPTEQLELEANASANPRALYALARRVTPESLPRFVELLDLEHNEELIAILNLPVRSTAIVALLVNASAEVRNEAEGLWFDLSLYERHRLRGGLAQWFDLPLLDEEHEAFSRCVAIATERLGSGDWIVEPTFDGSAMHAKVRHPDRRGLLIDADGSALRTDSYATMNDAVRAFAAGERTVADEAGTFVEPSQD